MYWLRKPLVDLHTTIKENSTAEHIWHDIADQRPRQWRTHLTNYQHSEGAYVRS